MAVVVGRSFLVGRPLALMLGARGVDATVVLAHSRTPELGATTRTADLLVVAAGRPRLIGGADVKPGATVIDVGTNRTEEGLVGDVDFDSVVEVAGAITPVPGGVGPMTIASAAGQHRAARHQARGRRDRRRIAAEARRPPPADVRWMIHDLAIGPWPG